MGGEGGKVGRNTRIGRGIGRERNYGQEPLLWFLQEGMDEAG